MLCLLLPRNPSSSATHLVVVGGGITELAPLHKGNSGDALDYWDRMIFRRPLGKEQLGEMARLSGFYLFADLTCNFECAETVNTPTSRLPDRHDPVRRYAILRRHPHFLQTTQFGTWVAIMRIVGSRTIESSPLLGLAQVCESRVLRSTDHARTIRLSSPLGAKQRHCLLWVDKPLKAEPVRIRLRIPHPSN